MDTDEKPEPDSRKTAWYHRFTRFFSSAPKTRGDVNALLESAHRSQLLDTNEFDLIASAMKMSALQVRDAMIPHTKMITVTKNSEPHEFLPKVIESGHSRFPVTDGETQTFAGLLHAKDLLPLLLQTNNDRENQAFTMETYLRPIDKVPESKRLGKLLQEFRATRKHMALVVDEYGSISGLITIEDILEELVGEIEDEFDLIETANIRPIGNHEYLIQAHTEIDTFNDVFNCQLNNHEFDTIAGLITQKSGSVPQRDEVITIDRFQFTVIHADNRRLYLLRLVVKQPS